MAKSKFALGLLKKFGQSKVLCGFNATRSKCRAKIKESNRKMRRGKYPSLR